jgi:hypothetical protein
VYENTGTSEQKANNVKLFSDNFSVNVSEKAESERVFAPKKREKRDFQPWFVRDVDFAGDRRGERRLSKQNWVSKTMQPPTPENVSRVAGEVPKSATETSP